MEVLLCETMRCFRPAKKTQQHSAAIFCSCGSLKGGNVACIESKSRSRSRCLLGEYAVSLPGSTIKTADDPKGTFRRLPITVLRGTGTESSSSTRGKEQNLCIFYILLHVLLINLLLRQLTQSANSKNVHSAALRSVQLKPNPLQNSACMDKNRG